MLVELVLAGIQIRSPDMSADLSPSRVLAVRFSVSLITLRLALSQKYDEAQNSKNKNKNLLEKKNHFKMGSVSVFLVLIQWYTITVDRSTKGCRPHLVNKSPLVKICLYFHPRCLSHQHESSILTIATNMVSGSNPGLNGIVSRGTEIMWPQLSRG